MCTRTHTHTLIHTHRHACTHSCWDLLAFLPSQALHTGCSLCLEGTSPHTCWAHPLNSCLRGHLIEALTGHLAMDPAVSQSVSTTHYTIPQLPLPVDMALAEGDLTSSRTFLCLSLSTVVGAAPQPGSRWGHYTLLLPSLSVSGPVLGVGGIDAALSHECVFYWERLT